MSSIFRFALEEMRATNNKEYKPCSFQGYLSKNNLSNKDTAQNISIDSLKKLDRELRTNNTMVFRLGSQQGDKGTYFGLAKCVNGWNDYFLIDEEIFGNLEQKLFR